MSKKDRLKAQKEKQDRLRKEAELEEQREREITSQFLYQLFMAFG